MSIVSCSKALSSQVSRQPDKYWGPGGRAGWGEERAGWGGEWAGWGGEWINGINL